jgi:CTP synthase (UTP-ammonia lyase)
MNNRPHSDVSNLLIYAATQTFERPASGFTMVIELEPKSTVAVGYGKTHVEEQYYCNFGVNPEYASTLRAGRLRTVGSDKAGEVRVVELADHPFFVGNLFLPQQNSSPQSPHPLVKAFIRASNR